MSEHVFIADLVQEAGDNAVCVHAIRRYVTSRFSESSEIEWIARPDQVPFVSDQPVVHRLDGGGKNSVSLIHARISILSSNGLKAATFHVLSYDRAVFEMASGLNDASRVVVCHHLAEVKKNAADFKAHVPRVAAGVSGVPRLTIESPRLSIEEAIDLAKRALRQGGYVSQASSLGMTQLRPQMMNLDRRARKDPTDPASLTLMKYVMSDGIGAGWLGYASVLPGQERVWLNESQTPQLPLATDLPDSGPTSISTPPNELNPASPSNERQSQPAVSEAGGAAVDQNDVPKRAGEVKRWQVFSQGLWDQGLNPPVIPRTHIFNAVQEIVGSKTYEAMSVGLLTAEACKQVISALEGTEADAKKLPGISRCCERIMINAHVLIDKSGNPIGPGVGFLSTLVGGVKKDDFLDQCEAFMLWQMVRNHPDIRIPRELGSVGLGFLRRGRDNAPTDLQEIRNRVDHLLALLKRDRRIDDSGPFLTAI